MKETKFEPRYMMATKAIHKLGDISREEPDLCFVQKESGDVYIGAWITGFGFVEVKFPKETTRSLTNEEIEYYNKKSVRINSQPPSRLDVG